MSQLIAYLDCHSGISGDMFLGAMLDAGFPLETLRQALAGLPVSGYELKLEHMQDKGIRGARFDVILAEQEQPSRHFTDIVSLLQAATLPPRARERARQQELGSNPQFLSGDIRNFSAKQPFDVALMNFNVIGYMSSNDDALNALGSARRNLRNDGLLIPNCLASSRSGGRRSPGLRS